jgi:xanthine/uracil/vitamin C permease (AzgA family)
VNAASFVLLAAFFGVLLSITLHSWVEGVGAGAVIGVIAVVTTRANHRRRLRNDTSAEYRPPRS